MNARTHQDAIYCGSEKQQEVDTTFSFLPFPHTPGPGKIFKVYLQLNAI